MKRILPILAIILFITACEKEKSEDMSIELAKPKLSVETRIGGATVTWQPVAKAAGYSYSIDSSAEKQQTDAETTQATLNGLSKGSHTVTVTAEGDGIHTTESLENSITFEIDTKLPTPDVTYEISEDLTSVTVKWEKIEQASGYVYCLNGENETSVEADVLSTTLNNLTSDKKYSFSIYAKGYGVIEDSDPNTIPISIVNLSEGVWAKFSNGKIIELNQSGTNRWTATTTSEAKCSFFIIKDGTDYGFTSYSGNGGIGTVKNEYAILPFYTFPEAGYYVRESIGQMCSENKNDFWIELPDEREINIEIYESTSDNILRYYIYLSKNTDESIIMEEHFDLLTHGGDWTQAGKNKQAGRYSGSDSMTGDTDGTEPGIEFASYTTSGYEITSHTEVPESYLQNRNLDGWEIANCYEFPGYIRLSLSSKSDQKYGVLTTPALTDLASGSKITVKFDGIRFASNGGIPVKIIGSGKITSAYAIVEGKGDKIAITPSDDGKNFIITEALCPKHANADFKLWSSFTFTVEGAGPDTKISWDTYMADETSGNTRFCLDNIVISK